jgi:lipid-binding SYLF domain-containing protein
MATELDEARANMHEPQEGVVVGDESKKLRVKDAINAGNSYDERHRSSGRSSEGDIEVVKKNLAETAAFAAAVAHTKAELPEDRVEDEREIHEVKAEEKEEGKRPEKPLHAVDPKVNARIDKNVDKWISELNRMKIPREEIAESEGVLILKVNMGGFILSGMIGDGVLIPREPLGARRFGDPILVKYSGGGIGLLVGFEVKHMVFVLKTRKLLERLERGNKTKAKVGVDLTLIKGIGTSPLKAPNFNPHTSRTGLYFGIELDMISISTNKKLNAELYGPDVDPRRLHNNEYAIPIPLRPLVTTLQDVNSS